jgi:hypothetical protein
MVEQARDRISGDAGFDALVYGALEHATECLEGATEGPLLPFAMIVDGGERSVRHFDAPGYEQTLDGALAFASAGDYDFWAVAWDGYMTVDGLRTEAVFVRAGGGSQEESLLFAWRYERVLPEGEVRRLGDPIFLGTADA